MKLTPLRSYQIGLVLSVVITLIAFGLVMEKVLSGNILIAAIIILALVQFVVQLLFFLHMGSEEKPYWNFSVFINAFLLILIIIGASLWIMNNLRYRHMTPEEQTDYILRSEGISK